MSNPSEKKERKSLLPYYLSLMVCILVWATVPLAMKMSLDSFGPITFAWLRGFTGFLVVLPLAVKRGLKLRNLFTKNAMFYGLMAFALNTMLMQIGMQWCSANVGSILNATMPVAMLIGGVIFLSEKLTLWKGLGAVLATLGIAVTCIGGTLIDKNTTIIGILIVATAPITWTAYSIYYKKNDPQIDPIIICAYLLGCGCILSSPLMLWEAVMNNGFHSVSVEAWILAAYAGMVCLGIGNVAWNVGVSNLEASITGLFYNTCPIIGVIFAVMFGERISIIQIVGCAVVILGIIIGMKDERLFQKRKETIDLPIEENSKENEESSNIIE